VIDNVTMQQIIHVLSLCNAAMCRNPMSELHMNVKIEGYEDPARDGDNVTFTCNDGFRIGPSSSTCKGNGEWYPDPGEVNCTGG
jgi:hypothetical protein